MRRRRADLQISFEAELSPYFDSLRNGMQATVHGESRSNIDEVVEHARRFLKAHEPIIA